RRVVSCGSATRITEPPRPPFPPSGPPSGLNFSRCTEVQPWPPSPAIACSTARSTNVAMTYLLPSRSLPGKDERAHRDGALLREDYVVRLQPRHRRPCRHDVP